MGADCGYGANVGGANVGPVGSPFTSTGAILVLYILLVIILSACFI
ncbi:YjcZ family sporulation protein [Paenibacillus sp. sgz5001063]